MRVFALMFIMLTGCAHILKMLPPPKPQNCLGFDADKPIEFSFLVKIAPRAGMSVFDVQGHTEKINQNIQAIKDLWIPSLFVFHSKKYDGRGFGQKLYNDLLSNANLSGEGLNCFGLNDTENRFGLTYAREKGCNGRYILTGSTLGYAATGFLQAAGIYVSSTGISLGNQIDETYFKVPADELPKICSSDERLSRGGWSQAECKRIEKFGEDNRQNWKQIENESYVIFKYAVLSGITVQESIDAQNKKVVVRFDPTNYCKFARPRSELATQ